MTLNDDAISSFMSLAQCNQLMAKKYLKRNHWNINYALNDFYDSEMGNFLGDSMHVTKQETEYPEELIALFKRYASDNGDIIDSDGLIKLIEDLDYSLDDLVTISLAKLLNCSNISNGITKENFLSKLYLEKCTTLPQLKGKLEELNTKLETDITYLTDIYKYTFDLVLDRDKRHLETPTAIEYWNLFFQPRYPVHIEKELFSSWINFLTEEDQSTISRDSWQMLIEFFKRFPSAEDIKKHYSESDAWPYIIDEFYDYLQRKNTI